MRRRRVKSTFKSVATRFYIKLCNVAKFLSLTLTLTLIPVFVTSLVFYVFVDYNPLKVALSCLCLWVCVESNAKM